MSILDENILDSQRLLLRSWRVPARQIGHQLGHKGMMHESTFCRSCCGFIGPRSARAIWVSSTEPMDIDEFIAAARADLEERRFDAGS